MAFVRALELLDLTIADPKNKNILCKDLLVMREALIDFFEGTNQYSSTDQGWYNYFMWFGFLAAYERERKRKKLIG